MKKKIALALITMMTVSVLSGCGNTQGNANENESTVATESSQSVSTENTSGEKRLLKDVDTTQYVELGEYKNIPVTVKKAAVDDKEVDAMALDFYLKNVTEENGGIKDREVQEGDTINLDYCGKLDGVAFAGGTAQGATLEIGSGTFIDGFEEQLIGTKPGDTPALNLTFPEGYRNEELAGKDVIFEVTVNYIMPTEMEDDVVKNMELDEFSDVAGLKQYVREYLELTAENERENAIQSEVLNYVMNNFQIKEIPQDLLENYRGNIEKSVNEMAGEYGVDNDTYCSYYYGMTYSAFLEDYAPKAVKQNLICQAIANAEGLNLSDEELDQMLQTYAAQGGTTVEEMLSGADKEDYREYFMFQSVIEFLSENAKITEK